MATTTQSAADGSAGIKKVWGEAVSTIQGRFEAVETLWNDTFAQVNTRLRGVESDVRDFVKRVEEDGRKRIETLRDQLNVDDLVGRVRAAEVFEQGARFTHETIERVGLVSRDDLDSIEGRVDKLDKKLETVRKRASASAKTKDVKALEKRVAQLEKASKK